VSEIIGKQIVKVFFDKTYIIVCFFLLWRRGKQKR